MTAFIETIGEWVINHQTWENFFVAAGIIIQGELTAFISVTLVLKNYLTWGGFLLPALTGIAVYDGLLFSLGKFLKNKPLGKKWEKKIRENKKVEKHLRRNLGHLLIVARFLVYVNVAAVVLSGLMDMKLKEFIKNRLFADILWLSVLAFGSYLILSGLTLLKLEQIEIGIAVFLILAFTAHALFRKFLAKKAG